MENLWPDDIINLRVETPLSVLRQQASLLSDLTRGVLVGDVATTAVDAPEYAAAFAAVFGPANRPAVAPSGNGFRHQLFVVAPSLKSYRHLLLEAWHSITLYPVLSRPGVASASWNPSPDEATFKKAVGNVLTSENSRKVLASLLSQSLA